MVRMVNRKLCVDVDGMETSNGCQYFYAHTYSIHSNLRTFLFALMLLLLGCLRICKHAMLHAVNVHIYKFVRLLLTLRLIVIFFRLLLLLFPLSFPMKMSAVYAMEMWKFNEKLLVLCRAFTVKNMEFVIQWVSIFVVCGEITDVNSYSAHVCWTSQSANDAS